MRLVRFIMCCGWELSSQQQHIQHWQEETPSPQRWTPSPQSPIGDTAGDRLFGNENRWLWQHQDQLCFMQAKLTLLALSASFSSPMQSLSFPGLQQGPRLAERWSHWGRHLLLKGEDHCQVAKKQPSGGQQRTGPHPRTDKPRTGLVFKMPRLSDLPPVAVSIYRLTSSSQGWCDAASCPPPTNTTLSTSLCPAHHPGKRLCPDLWHSMLQHLLKFSPSFPSSFLVSHRNCNCLGGFFSPDVAFTVMN